MIFTQQLRQCHGLVHVGQTSLSVPVPGGAILLCITHVVCDCYLSSSLFTRGWYQVVSSIIEQVHRLLSLVTSDDCTKPNCEGELDRREIFGTFCATEICYFQLLMLELDRKTAR